MSSRTMADVLVDTSVWVDFFRYPGGQAGDLLDSLLQEDRVWLCGVVEMEIMQGLRAEVRSETKAMLTAIPYFETTREDFVAGGELWQDLRTRGITIPPTDALIAAQCQIRSLTLFSLDAHFDRIEGLVRLR